MKSEIQIAEESIGLLDKNNTALRVKWDNALRAIMGKDAPKNKSGVALISDIDLILASDEQRLAALEKIK
jgi:phosphatidate phosphatase APP1